MIKIIRNPRKELRLLTLGCESILTLKQLSFSFIFFEPGLLECLLFIWSFLLFDLFFAPVSSFKWDIAALRALLRGKIRRSTWIQMLSTENEIEYNLDINIIFHIIYHYKILKVRSKSRRIYNKLIKKKWNEMKNEMKNEKWKNEMKKWINEKWKMNNIQIRNLYK